MIVLPRKRLRCLLSCAPMASIYPSRGNEHRTKSIVDLMKKRGRPYRSIEGSVLYILRRMESTKMLNIGVRKYEDSAQSIKWS